MIESVSINADYNRYTIYCHRIPNWEIWIKKPVSKQYNFLYRFLTFFFTRVCFWLTHKSWSE